MKKILIVEDDVDIHNLIKQLLEKTYFIYDAYSGTEANLILEKYQVDLILLDLMLPGMKGEELILKNASIPIIVISAKFRVSDKVEALLAGARDFIVKPFHNEELLARIEVQLRDTPRQTNQIKYRDILLDLDQYACYIKNQSINLTKTEFSILKHFIINHQQILSKTKLLELMNIDTPDGDENTLKVHISNIRKKIKQYTDEDYIEAIWGIGYRLL